MVEGRDSEHDGHRGRGKHRESPKQVRGRYQGAGKSRDNRDIFEGMVNTAETLLLEGPGSSMISSDGAWTVALFIF